MVWFNLVKSFFTRICNPVSALWDEGNQQEVAKMREHLNKAIFLCNEIVENLAADVW